MDKRMYKINADKIPEWIVAESKKQAFEYSDRLWKGRWTEEKFIEFKKLNPKASKEAFIESFVEEEPMSRFLFYFEPGNEKKFVFRTVEQILQRIINVPSYFKYGNQY